MEKINTIKETDFLNFNDLFLISNIKEIIRANENSELFFIRDILPQKGFRFICFDGPFNGGGIPFDFGRVTYDEIEREVQKAGYIIFTDEYFLYIGKPENQFKTNYISRNMSGLEDIYH